ncbi:MAG: hypothetical protein R3E68_14440 [Burkholderiaceae bacterium]
MILHARMLLMVMATGIGWLAGLTGGLLLPAGLVQGDLRLAVIGLVFLVPALVARLLFSRHEQRIREWVNAS